MTADDMSLLDLKDTFPSLEKPLQQSALVGIYFASSWCPDCSPITPKLKSLYESQLLIKNDDVSARGDEKAKKTFEVVYVSSDRSASEMEDSLKLSHGPWIAVPYDDDEKASAQKITTKEAEKSWNERSRLKRFFGACAGKEAESLDMVMSTDSPTDISEAESKKCIRKHGIPALIILDGQTGNVITESGVEDIEAKGDDALNMWKNFNVESSKRK